QFANKNPWEFRWGAEDQLAPVDDHGGIALFQTRFSAQTVREAQISATALGVFDLWCNGKRVGRVSADGTESCDELKPGWSEYKKRVLSYTYDLAPYLRDGENILLATVAPGWYNGRINVGTYGETHIGFLCALTIADESGERTILSDDSWAAAWGGAVRASDIWDGERYDAREPDFAALSSGDGGLAWGKAVCETREITVSPHVGPTVTARKHLTRLPQTVTIYNGTEDNGTDYGKIRVVRTLTNATSFALKAGETAVLDLGQNMVGWPRFTVKGAANTDVLVRMGEMLNDSGAKSRGNDGPMGSIYSINYRVAKSKIHYCMSGATNGETYCPHFTFFGFRYLELTATADVEFSDFACLVVGSDTRETGRIETSHKDVNRLISNILWGQRGNYLSVPTDCPQRDERLGWTGDTQAFCGTASYNADVYGFFRKWLQDARDAQGEDGVYPDVIPQLRVITRGASAWADAGIIVPYTMWKMYGKTEIVEEHFESMERYMAWQESRGFAGANATYGDWLAYEETDKKYVSAVYYVQNLTYMAAMADAIGRSDRAEAYRARKEEAIADFRKVWCDEMGMLKPEVQTQTGYLLALKNDLFCPELRKTALEALKAKILANGCKLSTGFVGSCILCEVLAEMGENNLAYSLLLQTEDPSWLYSVHQGATTIWERWNSYTLADGFGPVGMNSFNHYAYGAVEEWMYRHLAGIETTVEAPGFAAPILQPKPDTRTVDEIPAGQERITWVKASFDSPHGMITSAWDTRDGFTYECSVPVAATLYLPILTDAPTFTQNGTECRVDAYPRTSDGKAIVLSLAAGNYRFTA
ncbi:MAG: family 78 glycoside hydrolase catalytic domain, partial [Clostridia bacterium]|nr:family 78 glycoside hydrolase catalytic domain [Clostridia bacterium]